MIDRDVAVKLVNENVLKCNACYIHDQSFHPMAATINGSKIIVVTEYPELWMTDGRDFLKSKEYSELNVYFGESWLTRPVSPLSHTFAVKCPKSFFEGNLSNPSRCRMHTIDYVAALGATGVIAIGEEAKLQIAPKVNFCEIRGTKKGRLVLALKYPNQSSLQEISSSISTLEIFKRKIIDYQQ